MILIQLFTNMSRILLHYETKVCMCVIISSVCSSERGSREKERGRETEKIGRPVKAKAPSTVRASTGKMCHVMRRGPKMSRWPRRRAMRWRPITRGGKEGKTDRPADVWLLPDCRRRGAAAPRYVPRHYRHSSVICITAFGDFLFYGRANICFTNRREERILVVICIVCRYPPGLFRSLTFRFYRFLGLS